MPVDATALRFDWHGGPRRKGKTDAGADAHGLREPAAEALPFKRPR